MPSACAICAHPDRSSIEKSIADTNLTLAGIARTVEIPVHALTFHREHHMREIVMSANRDPMTMITNLLRYQDKLEVIATESMQEGERAIAIMAYRELRTIEEAKLKAVLQVQGLNRMAVPMWGKLRDSLVELAEKHPELREPLLEIVDGMEAK